MREPLDIGDGYSNDPLRLDEATSYHNAYLGFSFTLPAGWWLHDINSANLSLERGDTSDPALLDIIYGDNYRYMNLAHFSNLSSSSRRNYLGFYLSAEFWENVRTINDFMPIFEEQIAKIYGDSLVLLIADIENIGEYSFEKRIYEISRQTGSFRIVTMSAAAQNGYFLTMIAYYWSDNRNADSYIFDALGRAMTLE